MRVTFLIRERLLPGTAMWNAAEYDAANLRSLGHTVSLTAIPEGDMLAAFLSDEADLVIIEGVGWVAMDVLNVLVKRSKVVIRCHAAPEFLYYEFAGVCATEYIAEARKAGAAVAFVSMELAIRLQGPALGICYPIGRYPSVNGNGSHTEVIHVGCFGAIRPLKNHVGQVIAIARVAHRTGRKMLVHVNSTRVEGGPHILAELKALAHASNISFVGHEWTAPAEFKSKVIPAMTVGMFGSFAESFCLTAADFVAAGVPAVLSCHIPWAPRGCATNVMGLAAGLQDAMYNRGQNARDNWLALSRYRSLAEDSWSQILEKVERHVLTN